MNVRTTTEAPVDCEKQFAQIVVPTSSAHLYFPDGWEEVASGMGVTTLKKRIRVEG